MHPHNEGPRGIRGAETPRQKKTPAHCACVGCTSMPSHVKSSFQCMSPGTCFKAPSIAQQGMSPAMERGPAVDRSQPWPRRGGGGAHWVPLQEGGAPGEGRDGCFKHPSDHGSVYENVHPSRMQKKFLVRKKSGKSHFERPESS